MKRKQILSVLLAGFLVVGSKYSFSFGATKAKTVATTNQTQSISVTLKTPTGWKAYTKQELEQTVKSGSKVTGVDSSAAVNGLQYVIYNCKSTKGSSIVVFSQPYAVDPATTLSYMKTILTSSYKKAGLTCKVTDRNDKYSNIAFSTLAINASRTYNKITYSITQEYSVTKYKNRLVMILVSGVSDSEFKLAKSALKTIKIK